MRRAVFFFAASAMLSAHAYAAETKPASAKPVVPTAQSALASKEELAVAERLLSITGSDAVFKQMTPRIIEMMLPNFLPGNTEHEAEIRKIVSEEFGARAIDLAPLMHNKIRDTYASRFSLDELSALVAFYESPVGQKMARLTPEIQFEVMTFGKDAGAAAMRAALPRIIDRIKAANLQPPAGT